MKKQPSIYLCLLFDAVGYLSYLFPIAGEWTDIVCAPISAFLFYKLFGGKTGRIGAIISFAEEIVTFTDFIPTFTIAYFIRKTEKNQNIANTSAK